MQYFWERRTADEWVKVTGGMIPVTAFRGSALKTVIVCKEVTYVGGYAFLSEGVQVFFETEEADDSWSEGWDESNGGKADIYFYRAEEPSESGKFWHYSEDGVPVIWE